MALRNLWKDFDPEDSGLDRDPTMDVEKEKMRRQLRTSAARVAASRSRALKKHPQVQPSECENFSQRLQREYLTPAFWTANPSHSSVAGSDGSERGYAQFFRERSRCVWSYLQTMVQSLVTVWQVEHGVHHVVNACIADDTNTTMRGQAKDSERPVVHTVMNTCQAACIRYTESDVDWQVLHIPTSVQYLPTAKAQSLHSAFTAWMLVSASGLGQQWQRLKCPKTLLDKVKWQSIILVGDALKANDAAWRSEMLILCNERRKQRCDPNNPIHRVLGLRVRCGVHQAALIRRPVALSIEQFWTTLVRLGHLYEQFSFRRAISSALVSLVRKDGVFVSVLAGVKSAL